MGFLYLKNAGITTLKDLFEGDRMMAFDQLRMKYKLSQEVLFRVFNLEI